jgi:hypothetical protein
MRLVRVRRWSRVVALLLLVASLRPFHAAADDPGCAWADAVSSHDGTSFLGKTTAAASGTQDHCAICHWTRLLRSPLTETGFTVAATAATAPLECVGPHGYVAPTHDHFPARAPPAFLG